MTFSSPWMLLGLLGVALPIAIHLVGRLWARPYPYAAIAFLFSAHKDLARRARVRHALLMALRVALVGSIALMMARPAMNVSSEIAGLGDGQRSVVLVIDDTLSMRRHIAGDTLFNKAKVAADRLVKSAVSTAEIAVIRVCDPTGPLPDLIQDKRQIRRAIGGLKASFRHASLGAALRAAANILAVEKNEEKSIYVVSDFAAHGVPRAADVPHNISLFQVDVAPNEPPNNRAIVSVSARPSNAPGTRSMTILARICNFSVMHNNTEATLMINGEQVASRHVTFNAKTECTHVAFEHAFGESGAYQVNVSIPHDELREDDTWNLWLDVRGATRVAVINGDPSSIRYRDEIFYLQTALETASNNDQRRFVVTPILSQDIDTTRLKEADVVALCNVDEITGKQAAEIEGFVHNGGGLLVTVGDHIRPDVVNDLLKKLLPIPLRGARLTVSNGAAMPLRIGQINPIHPIGQTLSGYGKQSGLMRALFRGTMRLEPTVKDGHSIAIRYDDGSPALVSSSHGKGHVLLLTTTIDRDWTDLPLRPGYTPLVQQMILFLAGASDADVSREVPLGGKVEVNLPEQVDVFRLHRPDGSEQMWTAAQFGERRISVRAQQPGFYRFTGMVDGKWVPQSGLGFVSNIDAKESNLKRGELFAPARVASTQAASTHEVRRRVELWHILGLAILLLLLLETVVSVRG